MATVINNAGEGQPNSSSNNGAGMIVGGIIFLLTVILIIFYGIPMLGNEAQETANSVQSGTQVEIPEQVDVNVNGGEQQ